MDTSVASDERLMSQAAHGSRDAVGVLLRRYATPLLTFIRRMIGDAHRAEELFQEVFLAVWKSRRDYQYPRPFRAWLYGIAANQCRADLRRRWPATSVVDEDCEPLRIAADPTPVEAAIASEQATLVAQAVAALPLGQRTVVVLRIWNGLSYAEIADAVGYTEATARSHMFHGLAAVRKYLEPRLH
jgi:RNA polymerase sigma-70 factor, ECF subfamily